MFGNKSRELQPARNTFGAAWLLCVIAGAACEDDDSTANAAESSSEHENEHKHEHQDAGQHGHDEPRYVFTSQVFGSGADDAQSYLVVADKLDGAELSLDGAAEVAGRAIGVAGLDDGSLYVAGNADATVTRYALVDDELRKGDSISFEGEGLAALGEYGGQFQFVSDDKAYFFDGRTARVVIWNPKDMTLQGSIALEELVRTDATLTFTAAPVRSGDALVVFASWRKGPQVPSETAIVVVNTETDEATVLVDERCGYARDGVVGPDGLIYVATEAYGAAVHRLNADNAAAPCLLRFDIEKRSFDADFHVELNGLFGGSAASGIIADSDGHAFVRVLDEEAFEIKEDTNPRVLASAPAWRWAAIQLGDEPSAELLDLEPSQGSVIPLALDEKVYIGLLEGMDTTRVHALTEAGPGKALLTIPGLVFSGATVTGAKAP